MLQEIVLDELIRRRTALDIHAETHRQESFQLLTELLGFLQPGSTVGGDEVEGLERLLVQVRRLRLDQLNGHDTERPDIDLGAVLLLLDNLGSHPVGRADHGGAFGLGFGQLGAETKIG